MKYSPALNWFLTVFCGILFFFMLFIIPSFIWGFVTETPWKPIMVSAMNQGALQLLTIIITIVFMVIFFCNNNND